MRCVDIVSLGNVARSTSNSQHDKSVGADESRHRRALGPPPHKAGELNRKVVGNRVEGWHPPGLRKRQS